MSTKRNRKFCNDIVSNKRGGIFVGKVVYNDSNNVNEDVLYQVFAEILKSEMNKEETDDE